MFSVIKRNPTLSLKDLCRVLVFSGAEMEAPITGKSCYTGYSRFALYNFLKLLNLEQGSRVLVPAYVCDVILLPFSELGLEPVYYGITDRFQVDFDTIQLVSKIRAIITVNYFGMSQDFDAIKSFVSKHQLVWISDNSHGFASCHGTRKFETYGDFSITSFRKVLPTINGARACINHDAYASLKPDLFRLMRPDAAENKLPRFLAATLLGNLRYRPWKFPDYSDVMAFSEADIMAFQFDRLSASILRMMDEEDVQARRFRLYQAVSSFLLQKGYEFIAPISDLLQPGNSPMLFPVVVKEQRYWRAILQASRDLGIDIHTWPSLPREVIAGNIFGSATQWQKLLYLPIHQDLHAERYFSRLAEIFDSVRR